MRTREAANNRVDPERVFYSRIGDVPHNKTTVAFSQAGHDLAAWLDRHRSEPDHPQTWVRQPEPVPPIAS